MSCCVLSACPRALAADDEPVAIGYASVAAVLAALRADATAEFREQRGWTARGEPRGRACRRMVFHARGSRGASRRRQAHGDRARRRRHDRSRGALPGRADRVRSAARRFSPAARARACSRAPGARPDRRRIALDDHERLRVERLLAEEGMAAEIRFTDVLKLVVVPTLATTAACCCGPPSTSSTARTTCCSASRSSRARERYGDARADLVGGQPVRLFAGLARGARRQNSALSLLRAEQC